MNMSALKGTVVSSEILSDLLSICMLHGIMCLIRTNSAEEEYSNSNKKFFIHLSYIPFPYKNVFRAYGDDLNELVNYAYNAVKEEITSLSITELSHKFPCEKQMEYYFINREEQIE